MYNVIFERSSNVRGTGINACGLEMRMKQEHLKQYKKMIQIVLLGILGLYGYLCFKKEPIYKDTRLLMISAMFVVITLIAKRLAIMVPLFGMESLRISIELIPIMLSGYLLPLGYGYMIGIVTDLIGLIIVPTGFPFFGFTLSLVLAATLPRWIHLYFKNINGKVLYRIMSLIIILLSLGGLLFVSQTDSLNISKVQYSFSSAFKIAMIVFIGIMCAVFEYLLYHQNKTMNEKDHQLLYDWMMIVITIESLITFILTPLWLDIMYSIPFMVSLSIRLFKACFILPIDIIVGYALLKVIKSLKI